MVNNISTFIEKKKKNEYTVHTILIHVFIIYINASDYIF